MDGGPDDEYGAEAPRSARPAFDDDALRAVLDQLINARQGVDPRSSALGDEVPDPGSAAATVARDPVPVDSRTQGPDKNAEPGPRASRALSDPLTLLPTADGLRHLLAVEEARARRYGRALSLVQVEVVGIRVISERMGRGAAERALLALAEVLRTTTRRSDVYARVADWRIQGFMPETDATAGEATFRRVASRFDAVMGGTLPRGLAWAVVAPGDGESAGSALSRADSMVMARARRDADPATRSSASPEAGSRPASGGPAVIRTALVELETLRTEGLVSEDEYVTKRTEILARL